MQECPWCHADLGDSQLFSLDDQLPSECKECGGFIRNSRVREIASFLPSFFSFMGILVWELHPAFWLVPLVIYPFSKIFLAKPVKVQYEDHPCLRCKRLDVGFRSPYDKICDDCLTKEEEERSAKKNAR
ncbi:MAG TPA: hypothetical protein VE732_06435 [Nitrososphaera sp.]|jgi:hypothetical protein|nr:hypothetical protein [Nitrososphaera sp.]